MAEEYERVLEYPADTATGPGGAREKARTASRDVLDRAVEKKDELKQRAAAMADDRRAGVAERASSVSHALHGAADTLRENGEPQLSDWVHQAAGQVERVVGYLQGKKADGMADDLENLARQNPALFLGGTYLAGLALGRFLRASSPERRGRADDAGRTDDPGVGGHLTSDTGAADTSDWTGVGVAPGAFREPGAADTTSPGTDRFADGSRPADVMRGGGSDRDTDVFGVPRSGQSEHATRREDPEHMAGSSRDAGRGSGLGVDPESRLGSTRDLESERDRLETDRARRGEV
jgi:hypothetical protein